MKGLHLFLKDWLHIIKHKQARIAVIILLVIPLLYAGMFLMGYWDPYGNLDKLSVAVVNSDKGAQMNGKPIHVGEDLVDNLSTNKTLDFHFVSSDNAEKGLANGQYAMLVRIPDDFSQKVTTLMDESPKPADLIYKTNPGNNFIAGQVGATAITKLKDEISNEITKSYTQAVFDNIGSMSDGFAKAGNGATELSDGTKKANAGLHSVQDGIDTLADGATKLSKGAAPLAHGAEQLDQSMNRLKGGAAALSTGIDQLSAAHRQLEQGDKAVDKGLGSLDAGLDKMAGITSQAQTDAKSLTKQLRTYLQNHSGVQQQEPKQDPQQDEQQEKQPQQQPKQDQELKAILDKAEALTSQLNAIHNGQTQQIKGMNTLQSASNQVSNGLNQFGTKLAQAGVGASQLKTGASQMTTGMDTWKKGFNQIRVGIDGLAEGSGQLRTGSQSLAGGMLKLVDGSEKLSNSLSGAAKETAGVHSTDATLDMFSRPVQVVEKQINPVSNYGTAMTPYFLTLGLFVGGLIAANIIHYSRTAKEGVSGWNHFVNKLMLILSISVLQALIVDAVILYGFDIHVFSIPKFIFLSLIAAFTYSTCIFMLIAVFGSLGRLAAIFLLVMQLASSGGTFPLQMSSPFIQFISKILPMTYAVDGFRSVISTNDWSQYWHSTGALIGYIVAFVIVAMAIILFSNKKNQSAVQTPSASI
ncbi:YhgE/Pip domain-containing protein [Paenibacillus pini]|uniref:ABC-2 type transporter transmembrane domain-containing protein n=1 Tax=Paenibacillus pini JCM 16418 TaxID=1236976 RepID=W7YBV7_9BACL|nr:YhgE/Pip domain-containing protein [Paenibacillus pini]GAF08345.1 hypothetical protein JCM16418_2414 [Paenibacillus pini JCM 16418]